MARRAEEHPGRVFLRDVRGGEMTYGELHERALRWAGGLRDLGVAPGDTVLVMLPNSFDAATAWLAASWAGAMEVPVNTGYRGRILEYILNNSTARVLITCREYLERLEFVRSGLRSLQHVVVVDGLAGPVDLPGLAAARDVFEAAGPITAAGPDHYDIATIVYTSGTTGPSKGVLMPWAQCHAMSTGCIPLDGLGPDDAWYSPFPMFHMSGKLALYGSALFDGRFVIRDAFSTSEFWADIRRFGCTTSLLIGTTMSFIWSQPARPDDRDHPLRNVLMAPLPADAGAFMERFGVRICSVFNMTEVSSPLMTRWDLHGKSCGRLRDGYEVRIVDGHDEEVPVGEIGEIIVRSSTPWTLNAGYFGMPDKTAEAWRNGWFHTGDAGYVDADGYYYFVDRQKDAIRRRGENISSMELEALVNEHPDVLESAVIGVRSELGEQDVKVVVAVGPSATFDPKGLVEFLIPRVPRFMVPRYVEVVEALPKTPTLKVRKDELRSAGVNARTWDREAAGVVIPR